MKILLWLTLSLQLSFAQIIIDHTSVAQFESIPDQYLDAARNLTIHYGHTSHGSQIIAGLYWLQNNVHPIKYKVALSARNSARNPVLPNVSDALLMWEEGLWPSTNASRLGYWDGPEAFNQTQAIINSGMFDITGWSWCGEVANSQPSYIVSYLNALSNFNLGDVKLFYMTGHNVAPGPPNHQQIAWQRLHDNNQMIKDYVISEYGILFDFADIETYDPEGNYYSYEDGTGRWCEAYVNSHPGEYPNLPPRSESGCGVICNTSAHAHGLFTVLKAKAFWVMLAKIAGWGQPVSTIKPPEYLRIE